MNFCFSIGLLIFLHRKSLSVPIDNGVEGPPEIVCGTNSILLAVNIRNPFEGHAYVKGLHSDEKCKIGGVDNSRVVTINLPFDTCNTRRSRSVNPKGLFVSNVVVISFHPKFETKVDRAFSIQCFYMEGEKTVSTEIEVSMLSTVLQTQTVPMPKCSYTIVSGSFTGAPVRYAVVGQTVYHKWVCDTPHDKLFCMKVAGCTVDDGSKDKVLLLDENGCAVDKYLLGNLEYTTDLIAWREVHVFKYADRVVTYFQCQIEITLKEPNGLCPKPVCTYNNKGKREILQGNHSKKTIDDSVSITDVMTEITTLSPENLNYNGNENTISHTDKHRLCLNRFIVWSMVGLAVVFGFICVALFAAIRFRNLNLKLQT